MYRNYCASIGFNMANISVIGNTKVSGALIQTSVARKKSSLIVWECIILSVMIGAATGSLAVAVLSFMVLLGLIDTVVWIYISYGISIYIGLIFGFAAYGPDGSLFSALVFFLFGFSIMLGWHHWSLAYWRGVTG